MNALLRTTEVDGRTIHKCGVCGTTLRPGQPHSSLRPRAHQSIDMLTVYDPSVEHHGPADLSTEGLREFYHGDPVKSKNKGRVISGPLEYDAETMTHRESAQ